MSDYNYRITLAVPELLMPIANQLALLFGESDADINTFKTADWQDEQGNKYSVCSAQCKEIVISALSEGLILTKDGVDYDLAQQAYDLLVVADSETKATPDKITLAVGSDALGALDSMGLTIYEAGLI